MITQDSLPVEWRPHDLPPFWDGRAVDWRGWSEDRQPVIICPPPTSRDRCVSCGSQSAPAANRGVIFVAEHDNVTSIRRANLHRQVVANLYAFRCPNWSNDQNLWMALGRVT